MITVRELDLVWLSAFDLGKRCNPQEVAKKLLKAGIAQKAVKFNSRGQPELISLKDKEERDKASLSNTPDMLDLMIGGDLAHLYDEYRASGSYVRLKLRDIEIRKIIHPNGNPMRISPTKIEVYLLIHKEGFAVLSFWLFLKDLNLNTSDIILLERANVFFEVHLWDKLVEYNSKIRNLHISDKADSPNAVFTNIETIRNFYVSFIQSMGVLGEVSSIEEIESKLRYRYISLYPVVCIRDLGESLMKEFIRRNKLELHGILTKEEYWDWVNEEWVNRFLGRNLSWRSDWAVFIGNGAALLMLAPSVRKRVRSISRDPELQYRSFDIDVVHIVEMLLLQQVMLRTYDHMLSGGAPKNIRNLANLMKSVNEGLNEYFNVRIWTPKTAKEWVEYGQNVMDINSTYKTVKGRLELLERALRNKYDMRLNQLIIGLTLVAGDVGILQLLASIGMLDGLTLLLTLIGSGIVAILARLLKIT